MFVECYCSQDRKGDNRRSCMEYIGVVVWTTGDVTPKRRGVINRTIVHNTIVDADVFMNTMTPHQQREIADDVGMGSIIVA